MRIRNLLRAEASTREGNPGRDSFVGGRGWRCRSWPGARGVGGLANMGSARLSSPRDDRTRLACAAVRHRSAERDGSPLRSAPAWFAYRKAMGANSMGPRTTTTSRAERIVQRLLVAAQIACATVLLIGCCCRSTAERLLSLVTPPIGSGNSRLKPGGIILPLSGLLTPNAFPIDEVLFVWRQAVLRRGRHPSPRGKSFDLHGPIAIVSRSFPASLRKERVVSRCKSSKLLSHHN